MKNVNFNELSKTIEFNTKDIVEAEVLEAVQGMVYDQSDLEDFINSRSIKNVELIDSISLENGENHVYGVTTNDDRTLILTVVVNYDETAVSYISSENNDNFEYAYSHDEEGELITSGYRIDLAHDFTNSIWIYHALEAVMIIDYVKDLDFIEDLMNKSEPDSDADIEKSDDLEFYAKIEINDEFYELNRLNSETTLKQHAARHYLLYKCQKNVVAPIKFIAEITVLEKEIKKYGETDAVVANIKKIID